MLLICPVHTSEFLKKHNLGVEAHIGRYDKEEGWDKYIPFVHGVHLPYSGCNLAALDDELREASVEKIKSAIDIGVRYPVDRMVMHIIGIVESEGEVIGSYENVIDSIGKIADHAKTKGIKICLENQALHNPKIKVIGYTAEEWFKIRSDVGRDNVLLTLDTSHAATAAAHIEDRKERFDYMFKYLSHPELIGRVHWSDSRLTNKEAYMRDMHLIVGEGDLPREFHKAIKSLDAIKTLEQKRAPEDVEKGLAFIENL